MEDIPPFMLRELVGSAPKEIGAIINKLYRVFCEKDAILAEINPLVTTPRGVFAADAKIIVDDNALGRQGITVNRDLTEREREAEKHGFSYVELDGSIGVIGNGAGLTMATLDLIEFYGGKGSKFPRCRWRCRERAGDARGQARWQRPFGQSHRRKSSWRDHKVR